MSYLINAKNSTINTRKETMKKRDTVLCRTTITEPETTVISTKSMTTVPPDYRITAVRSP